ncbi:MAG TPA: acyltransferase [Moraxellaceae bacterium]
MPAFLPGPLIALLFVIPLALNTMLFASLIILFMPLRFLMPTTGLRRAVTALLIRFADTWCAVNNHLLIPLLPRIEWDVELPQGLSKKNWYFVIANHQSWVDIMVLFHIFGGRIPVLKYFLKQELIWIPFMGLGMYALDFPFMKRYSRETLEKHPELKGRDIETTRRSCEKFRQTPVSVMNFLEGTRITPQKHAQQQSPYRHLLKPKAGGMAFTLSALGDRMEVLLDTTIVYPDGIPTFGDFASGRLRHIVVRVQARPLPPKAFTHDYENDAAFRQEFQDWAAALWTEKDRDIDRLLAAARSKKGTQ